LPTRKAAIEVGRAHKQERRQLLVGSLQLPRPLPFPFIYPPNLYMLTSAVQRFVHGIPCPTRPILYGIRYCPQRRSSPTPPPEHRLARVSEIWRVRSRGSLEVVCTARGQWVAPWGGGRGVPGEGGGGGQVGGMTLSQSWRRHTAAATAWLVKPTLGASYGHATLPPRALVWSARPSCRRV
jgi:hypothetical protein